MRDVGSLLSAWNSFYVMTGSSAAALTGLMFVVISLVRDNRYAATKDGVSTFGTPTIVHFCAALFTSAYMSAPFRSFVPVVTLLALTGAAGLFYAVRVARRTQQLESYRADAEDVSFHVVLPCAAYATLVVSACIVNARPAETLYAPAAVVMLLIFLGIRNAWDVVTYIAIEQAEQPKHLSSGDQPEKQP